MRESVSAAAPFGLCLVVAALAGCHGSGGRESTPRNTASRGLFRSEPKSPVIRAVRCVFDQRPWLNLDTAGDRDPEGIRFRVFLVDKSDRGVLVDGTLHMEMYVLERQPTGEVARNLASDWHYSTGAIHTIAKPGMLGQGYYPHLAWKDKKVAGCEIEIIASFEEPGGNVTRSATKRLRVPKYTG